MEKRIDNVVVGDIQTNCWLYALDDAPDSSGKRPCVVIDPGGEAELIISRLADLNWIPHYVLLTHGHYDHSAGLPKLLEACKKSICKDGALPKVGIHRHDAHCLGGDALAVHRGSFAAAGGSPAYVDALWEPLPEADILFEEGDEVGCFKVLHVPGHTAGSVCYYDEKTGVLFTGDTLFQGDYGRTDLSGGSMDQLRHSLRRLLSMPPQTIVCPGHEAATTIKEEANLQF